MDIIGTKRSLSTPEGEVWDFHYRIHLAADFNHDVPFVIAATTGSKRDMTYVATIMEGTSAKPKVFIVDRG